MGAIDTFSAGFAVVNRRPLLLLFPLALDGLIWGSPAVSVGPVVRAALTASPGVGNGNELGAILSQYDLMALLGRFTPSLLASLGASVPALSAKSTLEVQQGSDVFWAVVGLLVAGFVFGTWYLFAVAQAVRGAEYRQWAAGGELLGVFARLASLVGIAVAAMAGMVVLLIAAGVVNTGLMGLVASIAIIGALWVAFYLFFAVDAVVIGGLKARQAIRASLLVFRVNFGAAAAIVLLATLIRLGLPIIWRNLAVNSIGLLGVIVVNAYIGTGLAAATMLFFREQWDKVQRVAVSPGVARR